MAQAISVQTCLCLREAGVFSFGRAKTFRDGEKGMDQSGSSRGLVAIDPGPKAMVREMAAAVGLRCKAGNVDEVRCFPQQQAESAVLKVLGPEEQAIRAGLEVSLQRAQEEAKKPNVWNSDLLVHQILSWQQHARKLPSWRKFWWSSRASGAEVDDVTNALDKAQVAAQEKPLAEQILECKGFVERAQKRLLKLEAERVAEFTSLEQGRARLVRLEAEAAGQLPVPAAVAELEAEVSRLRSELAATHSATSSNQETNLRRSHDCAKILSTTQSRRRGCG